MSENTGLLCECRSEWPKSWRCSKNFPVPSLLTIHLDESWFEARFLRGWLILVSQYSSRKIASKSISWQSSYGNRQSFDLLMNVNIILSHVLNSKNFHKHFSLLFLRMLIFLDIFGSYPTARRAIQIVFFLFTYLICKKDTATCKFITRRKLCMWRL